MNERIKKLAIDSNMLNYVDNETPRYYFLNGYADEFDLEKFAVLIIRECADIADMNQHSHPSPGVYVREYFGIN